MFQLPSPTTLNQVMSGLSVRTDGLASSAIDSLMPENKAGAIPAAVQMLRFAA